MSGRSSARLKAQRDRDDRQARGIFGSLNVISNNQKVRRNSFDSFDTTSSSSSEEDPPIMAPTIRPMNIWSSQGLDLSDSTFVKLYDSAIKFTEKDDNGEPIKTK